MLKNRFLLFCGILCVLAMVFAGCKSEPEPEPEQSPVPEVAPEPEPVPEVVPTIDVEPEGFTETVISPEDVEKCETLIEESKSKALACGADKVFIDEFNSAVAYADSIKADSKTLIDNADEAAKRFEAMSLAVNARNAKKRIDEMNFASYQQDLYDAGVASLTDYENLLKEDVSVDAKYSKAKSASDKLNGVINKAFFTLATDKKTEIGEVKGKAMEIKAQRADKIGFEAAQALLTTGNTAFENQSYESAFDFYSKAKLAFDDVYVNVSAKRAAAEEAIARAKEKAANVDKFAAEADTIAPLPEPVVETIE